MSPGQTVKVPLLGGEKGSWNDPRFYQAISRSGFGMLLKGTKKVGRGEIPFFAMGTREVYGRKDVPGGWVGWGVDKKKNSATRGGTCCKLL